MRFVIHTDSSLCYENEVLVQRDYGFCFFEDDRILKFLLSFVLKDLRLNHVFEFLCRLKICEKHPFNKNIITRHV